MTIIKTDEGIGPCIICWTNSWAPVPKDAMGIGDADIIQLEDKDYNIQCQMCAMKTYLTDKMYTLQYVLDSYMDNREGCFTLPNGDCINMRCKLHFGDKGMDIIKEIENANKRRA